MPDYHSQQWGCHRNGAAAQGTRIDKQQRNRAKRRASPELRAIAKAFDCDIGKAREILKAAQRANKRALPAT